jgi:glucokinase-like ROK family protein
MAKPQRAGVALVRDMNLSSVMRHIHREGSLSRAQLAQRTHLNKATISSLVEELIELGLIHENGMNTSGFGRPATMLDLDPQAGCIIGVEIGVGFISIILTNFTGKIIWRHFEELISILNQEEITARIFQLLDEAREIAGKDRLRLFGMGLALPGMVDVDQGILIFSPNLQWDDVPLRQMFSEHSGLPVFVDNDANAAALGEHLFGAARQEQHFLFIVAGVGVGGGLFLNGEIYRGACGLAGEIGHTSLYVEQTRPCRCGNRGCWENFANQSSLYERIRARLDVGRRSLITGILENQLSPLNLSIINQAAEAGDREVLEAISETGAALGLGVANLVNIFNPKMVVIGGSLSILGKYILPSIEEVIEERTLEVMRKEIKILVSAFGSDASVMGAVALVVREILSRPEVVNSVPQIL